MVKFSRDSEQQIEAFERKLARREITGSLDVTLEMAKVLRNVVNSCRWTSKDMLLELVKLAQLRLAEAQPIEIAVTSTGHRVGMIIAEEAKALKDEAAQAKEVKEPFVEGQEFVDPSAKQIMRDLIRQGIAEIIEEQETATSNIAVQCFDHIHSNEIILTMGRCKVVEAFLTEAAKSLKFQVIVAETAPNFEGHQLAVNLAKAGIETTVIADCAIFAFMARVNKVILGAHAGTPCLYSELKRWNYIRYRKQNRLLCRATPRYTGSCLRSFAYSFTRISV